MTKLTQEEREHWGGILNDKVRELDKLRAANAPLMDVVKVSDEIKAARRKLGMKPTW